MKVDACYNCFDGSLSNNWIERMYYGSEEARSASVWAVFHKTYSDHKNQYLSRCTIRDHYSRTLSNNCRTLSPALRKICSGPSFTSAITLQNQEDCGSVGRLIHPYVKQLCPELAFTQTIKNKCGFGLGAGDIIPSSLHPWHASLYGTHEPKPIYKNKTTSS